MNNYCTLIADSKNVERDLYWLRGIFFSGCRPSFGYNKAIDINFDTSNAMKSRIKAQLQLSHTRTSGNVQNFVNRCFKKLNYFRYHNSCDVFDVRIHVLAVILSFVHLTYKILNNYDFIVVIFYGNELYS